MRECLDEGILQSYFDGELAGDSLKTVTTHLAACQNCTAAAQELEAELSVLSSALAPEFEAAVPTEHLRRRIDAAIAGLHTHSSAVNESSTFSVRAWLQSLFTPFSVAPQRAFGYAGLILVLGLGAILGLNQWRSVSPAVNQPQLAETGSETSRPSTKEVPGSVVAPTVQPVVAAIPTGNSPANPKTLKPKRRSPNFNNQVAKKVAGENDDAVKLLPGERSYLQTIAELDSTIKSRSNRPMRPALQAEYERNLALVDRALAATRNAAKKNPNDPDAAEFMFAAYQNKVSLLNTVAEARTFNRQQD